MPPSPITIRNSLPNISLPLSNPNPLPYIYPYNLTTNIKKFLLLLTIGLCTLNLSQSQTHHILSQREQAVVINQWLEERIQTLLPSLMDRSGIDMWVVISREYNEDPVIRTFLPAT